MQLSTRKKWHQYGRDESPKTFNEPGSFVNKILTSSEKGSKDLKYDHIDILTNTKETFVEEEI